MITEIGNPNINSYVSSEEAYEYFESRSHGETWEDVDNYESFLITATNMIDWYFSFPGTKTDSNQPLEWPRKDAFDEKNQTYIDSNIIPQKIKYAVLELALASIEEDRTSESDMAGLQKVKVGTLEVVANSSGVWQEKKSTIPDIVYRILDGITKTYGPDSMFKKVIRT